MWTRRYLALICAVTLGCSSGDKNEPAADVKDTAGLEETLPDDVSTPDVTDVAADLAGDTDTTEAPLALSKAFAKVLCSEVLCAAGGCGVAWLDGVAEADCQKSCEAELPKDVSTASQLICARMGPTEAVCEAMAQCQPALDREPACVTFCETTEACGFLGSSFFGTTQDDCVAVCAAVKASGEAGSALVTCMEEAVASCSSPAVLTCAGQFQPASVCTDSVCNAPDYGLCSLIPTEFDSVETCQAECSDWNQATAYGVQACLESNEAMPITCTDLRMACMEVGETLPEGAREYADKVLDKCVVLEFMNGGGLEADLLAWKLTGMVAGTPGLYRSFSDSLECINQLSPCPQTELAPYYCLYNVSEESKSACAGLATLCTPEAYADEMVIQCETTLTVLHVMVPELESTKLNCLDAAETCEAKVACIGG